jgi:uncharacterized membrane protein YeaQ/YmgE (transglycosylase-associated protein family)
MGPIPSGGFQDKTEETTMDPIGIILWLVIGAVAGWLALIGGFVFGLFGITAGGLIGSLVTAVVGACVLLFVVGLIKRA